MSGDPQHAPTIDQQREWWNAWDREFLRTLDGCSLRRGDTALSLLRSLPLEDPQILEVGCGNGWLCEKLVEFGQVTGVDLADAAIVDAKRRIPNARFFAGDFLALQLPVRQFDVALTLETFSHVPDQPGFIMRLAEVLKPGGYLILITQNRLVYSRRTDVPPQGIGQIRRWVTKSELRAMVRSRFHILRAFTIEPTGQLGFLRFVNSAKLNAALSRVLSPPTLKSLKEWAGLGQSLVMLAQSR